MALKEYYKILGITPKATEEEIKKSFRRLALKFHPDKNSEDIISAGKFREIQEAYKILSTPLSREKYNYKLWCTRNLGAQPKNDSLSPTAILSECDRLGICIANVNIFQIEYDSLSYHIRSLLNEHNLRQLEECNDTNINKQVISKLLDSSNPLPLQYLEPIALSLLRLAKGNQGLQDYIQTFVSQRKQRHRWNKYRIYFVIIVTSLLCLFIYELSK